MVRSSRHIISAQFSQPHNSNNNEKIRHAIIGTPDSVYGPDI